MDPRKDDFVTDHLNDMRKFEQRIIVLLVDSENDPKRLQRMRELIPADLENRVFVLGVLTEPEALKQKGLGSYDEIGKKMADECRTGIYSIWMDDLLRQNENELVRLHAAVCDWLF